MRRPSGIVACVLLGWSCLAGAAGAYAQGEGGGPATRPRAAVIAGQDDSTPALAELVTAEVTKAGRVDLVERAEIGKVVKESEFQAFFAAANARSRRQLGAFLRADFLLLLRMGGPADARALEVVVAETRFGYRLSRQTYPWDRARIGQASEAASALLLRAVSGFAQGVKLAVAVPPFYSRDLTHHFDYLQGAYARVAEVEALRRPGCVVVEIEEAKAIADELGASEGTDAVKRAPPFYLVGAFRHESVKPDSPVTVTLRLELGGKRVAESSGKDLAGADAAAFVRRTAEQMLGAVIEKDNKEPGPRDASAEVARLLDSAGAFRLVGAFDEAAALFEAALLLDPASLSAREGALAAESRLVSREAAPRAEWWTGLEGKPEELKQRLCAALRASQHLAFVARTKEFRGYKELQRSIEDLWDRVEKLAWPAKRAGLDDELAALTQSAHDFWLRDFLCAWRRIGRTDERWWGDMVHDYPFPAGTRLLTRADFDYRLTLLRTVFAGRREAWYRAVEYVAYDRSLAAGATDKKAVEESVREHGRFVDEVLADKDPFLSALARYVRFREQAAVPKEDLDFVALAEMERAAREFDQAGFWQPADEIRSCLREMVGAYRYLLPNREHLLPSERLLGPAEAVDTGRLRFKSVEVRFLGAAGPVPRPRGLVRCSDGTDAFWWSSGVALMQAKGAAKVVFEDAKTTITDVCWDGRSLWAATRQGRILQIDVAAGTVRTLGDAEGVPDSAEGMCIWPVSPGRVCAVGSLPPHRRAWCALVGPDGKVDIFHEARELGKTRDDAGPELAFAPDWMCGVTSPDGKTVERILVQRRTDGPNKYAMLGRPLVLYPDKRKAEVLPVALTSQVLDGGNIVQAGDFLFMGAAACRLPDLKFQAAVLQDHSIGFKEQLLAMDGKVIAIGAKWVAIDPKTLRCEILGHSIRDAYGQIPRAFRSHHYGILSWSMYADRRMFEVSIEGAARAADSTRPHAPDPKTPSESATPAGDLPPDSLIAANGRKELPILGLKDAENLITGERTEDPEQKPLHAAPGDVLRIRPPGRSSTWTHVLSGTEPRPLKFSEQRAKDRATLALQAGESSRVVAVRLWQPFSQAKLEQVCREQPDIAALAIAHPCGKDITDLSPIAALRNLESLEIEYGIQLKDLKPLAGMANLAALQLLQCDNLENIEALASLKKLKVLSLRSACGKISDIKPLGRIASLERLVLGSGPRDGTDLEAIAALTNLKHLAVADCSWRNELKPLAALVNLRSLHIGTGMPLNTTSIEPLGGMVYLKELSVNHAYKLESLAPLARLKRLERVTLWTDAADLKAFSGLQDLTYLFVTGCDDLAGIEGARNLTELYVSRSRKVKDLAPLAGLVKLERLTLRCFPNISDVSALAGLAGLTSLNLERAENLGDIAPLGKLSRLTSLKLSDCAKLADLGPLASLTNLTQLDLRFCRMVSDVGDLPGLKPLANLKKLEQLDLDTCTRVSDLRPLAGLPALSELNLQECANARALSQLGRMPRLKTLYITKYDAVAEEIAAFKKQNPGCTVEAR